VQKGEFDFVFQQTKVVVTAGEKSMNRCRPEAFSLKLAVTAQYALTQPGISMRTLSLRLRLRLMLALLLNLLHALKHLSAATNRHFSHASTSSMVA
jgi:hypothetical protein